MNTPYISAEQQISYRLTLLGATAAEHPYSGQLDAIRTQIEELIQAFALYRIGQLAPIPTQHEDRELANTLTSQVEQGLLTTVEANLIMRGVGVKS